MDPIDDPLDRVLWIGGGSGSGKSTVAEQLASVHGFGIHHIDEKMSALARSGRLSPRRAPLLHRFLAMDMDERWVERSPQEMLESFHWFQGEGFDLLIDDVRSQAAAGPLIVEGFHLLPRLLAPLLPAVGRAVWLLPTPAFRAQVFRRRLASGAHFVERTCDPGRALANLLERDRLFTEQVRAEVDALGLVSIDVDGSRTVAETAVDLSERFRLG